jgi:predicted ATP-dependent protease
MVTRTEDSTDPSASTVFVSAPRPAPLQPETLRKLTPTDGLSSGGTPSAGTLIGQDRALEAIRFAADIDRPDFNLFVMGSEGSGRHSAVHQILGERAAAEPAPDDWVYVNNFVSDDHPHAIRLPVGTAFRFQAAMEELIADLGVAVPALFESDDYKTRRDAIEQEFEQAQEERFTALNEMARAEDVAILRTPMGFAFAPQRDGKVLPPEEFKALPAEEQKKIEDSIEVLQHKLKDVLSGLPRLEKDRRDQIRALNKEMATALVAVEIADVENAFKGIAAVSDFLSDVSKDIVQNVEVFIEKAEENQQSALPNVLAPARRDPRLRRYTVNVMVGQQTKEEGQEQTLGAPVVIENNPTYQNLIGRIEHISQMGALLTDFALIKSGALHRANGGYLILDVRQVLTQPAAWDGLKRCLKAQEVRINSLAEQYSLQSTISLDPDPIPLTVRVILIGDRRLYYLLHALDPGFRELFKVQADFEDDMARHAGNIQALASLMAQLAQDEGLKPLTEAGMARLFDEASRHADDAEKVSLRIDPLADILREADHLASDDPAIDAHHIASAITRRRDRAGRLRERMQEGITRETILIDTDGKAIGQINGLSVISLGDQAFGRPSRITATTRLGTGKVIDIEREAKLGGPLHSKGVLILSGYLASHYATTLPMSLWASLVLEQSYGGVEGDSASSAELYALLSSLAEVPIDQSFAVTGSVNQRGDVQAIGGVNEKIEGFFDICVARGLTGRQGVLIPEANVKHLMLREDVVAACQEGQFSVHAVKTIDEGIAILTGVAAGARGPDGVFPPGTINSRVEARLTAFADARRRFAADGADTVST